MWDFLPLVFLLLARGMTLFPFRFNLLSTCFIYFCRCRNCLLTLMITKSKWIEEALIPRIQQTGGQGYSSSYLHALSVLQWSDFNSRFNFFIILKGQRRAFCQCPYKPWFPIHYTNAEIHPQLLSTRSSWDLLPFPEHQQIHTNRFTTCSDSEHFVY